MITAASAFQAAGLFALPAKDLWQQPWMLEILRLPVTGTGAEVATRGVMVAALVLLALRLRSRLTRRWGWEVAAGLVFGALAGLALILVFDVWLHEIPMGLPLGGRVWVTCACSVAGLAVVNVIRTRWWRKILAVLTLAPVAASMAVGVNASYGILHSVGEMLSKPTAEIAGVSDLPQGAESAGPAVEWIAHTWKPPADMPAKGRRLTMPIPATTSGFVPRPASVYLPPAAQVAGAPRLPVLLLMMGQPGTPDVTYVADALDAMVGRHAGLAPIVVVADQIGDPYHDTLCMDTKAFGKAETYINTDVVAWIKANLKVSESPSDWVVAGYSNGGLCAGRFLALHPQIWGNAIDIAGEEYPGSDHPARHLKDFFGGDKAAYEKARLPRLFEGKRYDDHWLVGTVSADDPHHVPGIRRVLTAAKASGVQVSYLEFPTGGHGVETLKQGLAGGIAALYPRLGLDAGKDPTKAHEAPAAAIPSAPPAPPQVP